MRAWEVCTFSSHWAQAEWNEDSYCLISDGWGGSSTTSQSCWQLPRERGLPTCTTSFPLRGTVKWAPLWIQFPLERVKMEGYLHHSITAGLRAESQLPGGPHWHKGKQRANELTYYHFIRPPRWGWRWEAYLSVALLTSREGETVSATLAHVTSFHFVDDRWR